MGDQWVVEAFLVPFSISLIKFSGITKRTWRVDWFSYVFFFLSNCLVCKKRQCGRGRFMVLFIHYGTRGNCRSGVFFLPDPPLHLFPLPCLPFPNLPLSSPVLAPSLRLRLPSPCSLHRPARSSSSSFSSSSTSPVSVFLRVINQFPVFFHCVVGPSHGKLLRENGRGNIWRQLDSNFKFMSEKDRIFIGFRPMGIINLLT